MMYFPPPPLQHCSSPSPVSTWLLFLALLSPGLWWHLLLFGSHSSKSILPLDGQCNTQSQTSKRILLLSECMILLSKGGSLTLNFNKHFFYRIQIISIMAHWCKSKSKRMLAYTNMKSDIRVICLCTKVKSVQFSGLVIRHSLSIALKLDFFFFLKERCVFSLGYSVTWCFFRQIFD